MSAAFFAVLVVLQVNQSEEKSCAVPIVLVCSILQAWKEKLSNINNNVHDKTVRYFSRWNME